MVSGQEQYFHRSIDFLNLGVKYGYKSTPHLKKYIEIFDVYDGPVTFSLKSFRLNAVSLESHFG